jgi:hypothetical protein
MTRTARSPLASAKRAAPASLARQDAGMVLSIIFQRLYTLRTTS